MPLLILVSELHEKTFHGSVLGLSPEWWNRLKQVVMLRSNERKDKRRMVLALWATPHLCPRVAAAFLLSIVNVDLVKDGLDTFRFHAITCKNLPLSDANAGGAVSVVAYQILRKGGAVVAFISCLGTHPNWRDKGLARLLLYVVALAAQDAAASSGHPVFVELNCDAARAGFYESLGFSRNRMLPKDSEGCDREMRLVVSGSGSGSGSGIAGSAGSSAGSRARDCAGSNAGGGSSSTRGGSRLEVFQEQEARNKGGRRGTDRQQMIAALAASVASFDAAVGAGDIGSATTAAPAAPRRSPRRLTPQKEWERVLALKPCLSCGEVDTLPNVLCDRCDDCFHLRCLDFPAVPSGEWLCARCLLEVNRLAAAAPPHMSPTSVLTSPSFEERRAYYCVHPDALRRALGEEETGGAQTDEAARTPARGGGGRGKKRGGGGCALPPPGGTYFSSAQV